MDKSLLKYIKNKEELYTISSNLIYPVSVILKECISAIFQNLDLDNGLVKIESVLDFITDELNTGHWSKVPIHIRQCYSIASFVKSLLILRESKSQTSDLQERVLKIIDMGLLLGAPLSKNEDLLTESAKELSKQVKYENIVQESGKRKFSHENLEEFEKIEAIEVKIEECPSLEYFNKHYFEKQLPVKIRGCMHHWPAMRKWADVNYLLEVAGNRIVPVEIGSHYVHENWSQKIMPLKQFIQKHYLSESGDIGYLAQHNLFEQITELKEDICIPEYCSLSDNYEKADEEPDINAWLGPSGTVSPLHQDPKNNILTQVYGCKRIILVSPEDTRFLYPYEDKLLSNTAKVDPINPNFEEFPEFVKAKLYKCLLNSGEMLFIPVKWWHHVSALEKSFSVSFWWQ